MSEKKRLDLYLQELDLLRTRSQARDFIKRGLVLVDGKPASKPGQLVNPGTAIEIKGEPAFVGRGAEKLAPALERFKIDVGDRIAADIGASTGGFTQILLQKGARKVYAIDVGTDQLVSELRTDPRVVTMEGTNIREVRSLPDPISLLVADLSFISLKTVLSHFTAICEPGADLVLLVKPQFELGPEFVGPGGIVKDPNFRKQALDEVVLAGEKHRLCYLDHFLCPIAGKKGNREWLLALRKKP